VRSRFVIVFTALIVIGFATFMLSYTVRFTEVAIETTFGEASEESVVREAGLHVRWPYPVQRVAKYDTRVRFLQARGETQQTVDDRQVIVEAFITWRISDALKFYRRFGEGPEPEDHYRSAERTLESLLRSAMSEVSAYRLDELFTIGGSKLGELENRIRRRLVQTDQADARLADYGIEPEVVAINRVLFPQETTSEVFQRMRATRERLAAEARSRGEVVAQTIVDDAESAAARIRAFAEQRAEQIRVQGEIEASRWYERLGEEPTLAVFLEKLDFMKNLYAKRATLLLSTKEPGLDLFDPNALEAQTEAASASRDAEARTASAGEGGQ